MLNSLRYYSYQINSKVFFRIVSPDWYTVTISLSIHKGISHLFLASGLVLNLTIQTFHYVALGPEDKQHGTSVVCKQWNIYCIKTETHRTTNFPPMPQTWSNVKSDSRATTCSQRGGQPLVALPYSNPASRQNKRKGPKRVSLTVSLCRADPHSLVEANTRWRQSRQWQSTATPRARPRPRAQ